MLTGIELRNFKAFGNEMQEAPLSKITLIYGPNSGGKSSIIQALLLLKQSAKSNAYSDSMLSPIGEFADLGNFQSMLHKRDTSRNIGIGITYESDQESENNSQNSVVMTFSASEGSGHLKALKYRIVHHNEVLLDANLNHSQKRHMVMGGSEFEVEIPSWEGDLTVGKNLIHRNVGWLHLMGEDFGYNFLPRLILPEIKAIREKSLPRALPRSRRTSRVSSRLTQALRWTERINEDVQNEIDSYAESMEFEEIAEELGVVHSEWDESDLRSLFREELERSLLISQVDESDLSEEEILALTPESIPDDYERQLRLVNYLGPLRNPPERTYRLLGTRHDTTGVRGENSANVLYYNTDVQQTVNHWFGKFGIPYELSVVRLGEAELAGEHIAIALRDKRTKTQVTLVDVGFGINQLLPIIIEGVTARPRSIICVEQPEIHLHPRLQANIADMIVEVARRGRQWIIETHSEMLIRRIQRRIRDASHPLNHSDVSVLYVDPAGEVNRGSTIKVLRINENGDFVDKWPHGFFDDSLKEYFPGFEDPKHREWLQDMVDSNPLDELEAETYDQPETDK